MEGHHNDTFRVTHYAIFNVILYAFYEMNGRKLTFFLISFVKRIQDDAQDDVMRDAKCPELSHLSDIAQPALDL